jgi:hypothetical protein
MSKGSDNNKAATTTPEVVKQTTTASKAATLLANKSLPGPKTYSERAGECRALAQIYPYWRAGYLRLAARYEFLAKLSER